MWEAYGMTNEDLLWAGTNFFGGIVRHQKAPCGAVSGAAIALGLRYACPSSEKEMAKQSREKSREDAAEFVQSFVEHFNGLTCEELAGYDLSDEEDRNRIFESGEQPGKCHDYVKYAIARLYELDAARS